MMMGEKLPALGDVNRSKRWKAARRQRGKIEEQRPHIDDRQALAASGELASARSEAKYEQKCKQRRDGGEEMRIAENLARQKQRHAELSRRAALRELDAAAREAEAEARRGLAWREAKKTPSPGPWPPIYGEHL